MGNGLDSILKESFLWEDYVQHLSNTILLDLNFVDRLDPWDVLLKEDYFATRMDLLSFQEGLLYDRFSLNGAKKPNPNF